MIQEIKKSLGLWLYPQSKRLGDEVEQEFSLKETLANKKREIDAHARKLSEEMKILETQKDRMRLYRNLLNTDIISLQNTDQEIRHDIEQNCHLFITKESSQLMFRHMLSWYVNDSLFDNGGNITDDFFRGTINGIHMVQQFMVDQSLSFENRQKNIKR